MAKRRSRGFATMLSDALSEGDRAKLINANKQTLVRDSITTDEIPGITPDNQPTVVVDEQPPAPAQPALTLEAVQGAIASALQSQKDSHQAELDKQKAAADQAIADAKAEAEAAKNAADNLQKLITNLGLDKFTGQSQPANGNAIEAPNVNRNTSVYSDRFPGAVADFMAIRDSAPKIKATSPRAGQVWSYDQTEIKKFVRDNKKQLINDLETWGKRLGMFQGSGRVTTDAATIASDIPGGFLETLSALMRSNNRPGFIFHQFARTRIDFAARMGTTIDIPRAAFLPAPASSDDRLLSGAGTFIRTDPGRQRLQTGIVQAIVKEWGLGKDSTCPPVGIPTFVEAFSMIDLMQILNRNLAYDYYQFEEVLIYELFDQTSRIVYNDRGSVTTDPTAVGTGDDGTLTETYMNNLFAYMRSLQIPTYENNMYALIVNDFALAQLKNTMGTRFDYANEQQIQEITNILQADTATGENEGDRASGYVGAYNGFMVFQSNNFGMGAAGTRGVQNVTIGGAVSALTRSNWAIGAGTIGRGVAKPMEILRDSVDDFGRLGSYVWNSWEGVVAMDLDPTGFSDTSAVPQQLRCIEVRTLGTAV